MEQFENVIEFAKRIENDSEIRAINKDIIKLGNEVISKVSPEVLHLLFEIDFLMQKEKTLSLELLIKN